MILPSPGKVLQQPDMGLCISIITKRGSGRIIIRERLSIYREKNRLVKSSSRRQRNKDTSLGDISN